MAGRSGSNKRKRTAVLTIRVLADEAQAIRAKADAAGQSVAGLLRQALLTAPVRVSRRAVLSQEAVARLMGQLAQLKSELGKHGSNLNQLAYHANLGRYRTDAIELAVQEVMVIYERDLAELRLACLQALGREPSYRAPRRPDGSKLQDDFQRSATGS